TAGMESTFCASFCVISPSSTTLCRLLLRFTSWVGCLLPRWGSSLPSEPARCAGSRSPCWRRWFPCCLSVCGDVYREEGSRRRFPLPLSTFFMAPPVRPLYWIGRTSAQDRLPHVRPFRGSEGRGNALRFVFQLSSPPWGAKSTPLPTT